MFKKGDIIQRTSGNIYVVCEVKPPPAGSACNENLITLAQQVSGENRPLMPEETGLFEVLELDLDDCEKIA